MNTGKIAQALKIRPRQRYFSFANGKLGVYHKQAFMT